MNDLFLNVSDVTELMSAMHKFRIGSLRFCRDGSSLELEALPVPLDSLAPPAAPLPPILSDNAPEPVAEALGSLVSAPIVGVFYAAPAPDKPPFVCVGSHVKKGDVLFIIESMKLMNEVQCDFDGVVSEILVENGQGVEFGQPILRIQ